MQTVDERKRLVEHFCAYKAHQFFLKVQEAGVRRCVCRRHDMEDSVAPESHIDLLHGTISWITPVEWSSKLMCALCAHLLALERQRRPSCLPYSDTVRWRSSCSMHYFQLCSWRENQKSPPEPIILWVNGSLTFNFPHRSISSPQVPHPDLWHSVVSQRIAFTFSLSNR